ncbi:D-alanyl-D-alanine carboxypeptidase family protein [Photobacterium profundum]|uniref:serine-type D-Ala-D-Ala carboxypeptidase n=1 Tax=Photobacterium profundum 3TCK TaxID=314280 RepID=Q1Z5Z5_9GAMM|nr:D-alanyl-D-alanine carboxypeptidase [Photobacterium profundum 3TCK]
MKRFFGRIVLGAFSVHMLIATKVLAVVIPEPPALNAKGYVLMDFQSGSIIAENNPRDALAPASLTKLMTAYVVGQEINTKRLKWDDMVTVGENAWSLKFPDSSKMFIKPGDEISVENLMRGVIIQSGNDASVALAEYIAGSESGFVNLMNGWAKTLKLQDTRFINAHGLDGEGIQTSPADMATLMRHIIRDVPDVYALYQDKQFAWNDITQFNRNKLLWDKALNVDGGKTGYTEQAGYSLVSSATEGSRRLIAVVMGTPSQTIRAEASKNLLSYGFRFYDTQKVVQANESVFSYEIWKGATDKVTLGVTDDKYITLPRNMFKQLTKIVDIDQPLFAPIVKGDVVGNMVWQLDGETVARYPLISNETIEAGSFIDQIWDTLWLWLQSSIAGLKNLWEEASA